VIALYYSVATLSPGNERPYPLNEGWVDLAARLNVFGGEKIFAPAEIQTSYCLGHNLASILTLPSWLAIYSYKNHIYMAMKYK
jgi:hypothetical protein